MIDQNSINPPSIAEMFQMNGNGITRIPPANVDIFNSAARNQQGASLEQALNPQEPIDVLGTKVMGSINLVDDMKHAVPMMQIEQSDIAVVSGETMKMGGELLDRALNIFGGDEPKPDPMAELERKLENNVRTPPPPQVGMGIGGGPSA